MPPDSKQFEQAIAEEVYETWSEETVRLLKDATLAEFKRLLEQQLDVLISRMAAADQRFGARIAAVRRGFLNYAAVRDDLLRLIQSHRASLEYTNQHPQNQPFTSNIRFIYSPL